MKLSQLHLLKDATLAHKQDFSTKEFSKKQQYITYKDLILDRIRRIEDIEMTKCKYLEDINGYLKRLEEKFNINILPVEETAASSASATGGDSLIPA